MGFVKREINGREVEMTKMEMKRAMIKCLAFFLVFQLTACGSSKEASNMTGKSQGGQKVKISKEIENIPDKYMYNSEEPGTLVDFYYDTYESFSYNLNCQIKSEFI